MQPASAGRRTGHAVVVYLDHTEGTHAAAELLRTLFDRVVRVTPRVPTMRSRRRCGRQ